MILFDTILMGKLATGHFFNLSLYVEIDDIVKNIIL